MRIDSITEQTKVAKLAHKNIIPPESVTLDECDMPFFDAVIAEFARSEWTDHSLQCAAMLARMMADMEREQRILRGEGSVAYSEKGTPVVNPRKTVVQMLAGSILSMRRSLQLHARAQNGEAGDAAKRKARGLALQNDFANLDDLIARAH